MSAASAAGRGVPRSRPVGALPRHRALTEGDWRRCWALAPVAHLPGWARPVPSLGRPPTSSLDADPVTTDLLVTATRATTLLELRASCGRRGVLAACAVADGQVTAVTRELVSVDGGTTLRPIAGVHLSGLGVERLVEWVIRLVPPDREAPGREVVRLAVDRAFALADASRDGTTEVWEESARQLGVDQPLGVLRALARGLLGTLDVRVRAVGAPGGAFVSWLLTDEGWVLVRVLGTEVIHTPVGRGAIRARVLAGFTAHLAAVAPRDGSRPGAGAGTGTGTVDAQPSSRSGAGE